MLPFRLKVCLGLVLIIPSRSNERWAGSPESWRGQLDRTMQVRPLPRAFIITTDSLQKDDEVIFDTDR